MKRLKKTDPNLWLKKYYHYQWEHIRRDERYQKDFDAFREAKKNGKPIPWPLKWPLFPADYRNEYPGLRKKDIKFRSKKKVSGPWSKWKMKYSVHEAVVFYSQVWPHFVLRIDAWSKQSLTDSKGFTPYDFPGMEFIKMTGEDIPKLKDMKALRLVIDIRQPKTYLLDKFETMIDFYQKLVPHSAPSIDQKFTEYENDLKIWDLWYKCGCNFSNTAQKQYPDDFRAGEEKKHYAVKKVKRAVERCQQRIDNGI